MLSNIYVVRKLRRSLNNNFTTIPSSFQSDLNSKITNLIDKHSSTISIYPSDSRQSIAITHHRATNKNEQIHHWQRKNKTSQSIAIPRHKVVIDSTNFAGWSGHPSIVKSADQTRISLSIDYHLVFDNYSSFPRSLSICNSFFSSILFRLAVHFFPLMTQERWTSRQRRGCVIIISDVISDSCFRFTCSLYTCLVGEGWLRIIARPVDTYYWAWTF